MSSQPAIQNTSQAGQTTGGRGGLDSITANKMDELERLKLQSKTRAKGAEAQVAQHKASQGANQAAGTAGMAQGEAQKAQGLAGVSLGGVMVVAAVVLMAASVGFGSVGAWGMLLAGLGAISQGTMQLSQGNDSIDRATQKLADAVNDGVLAKEQAGVANKEMTRSNMFAAKQNLLRSTMDKIKSENPDMSKEDLEVAAEQLKQGQDKSFERAAQSLRDGGIMTYEAEGGGLLHYTQEEDGSFSQVSVQMGEDGEPLTGKNGELMMGEKLGTVSEDDPLHLQLQFDFIMAEEMKEMITGDLENDIPPLAKLEIGADGKAVKGTFDLNSVSDMNEFFLLAETVNDDPPPFKFFEEEIGKDKEGNPQFEQYFQEWDWENDKAAEGSKKFSMEELTGGEYDPNDPKSIEEAKARSEAAFKELGLGPESETYKLLSPLVELGFENDIVGLNGETLDLNFEIGSGVTTNVRDSILGGEFGDFGGASGTSFADNTRNTVQNVLNSGRFGGIGSNSILNQDPQVLNLERNGSNALGSNA